MSQPPALQRLPHPWLDNSWPKSKDRPDIFYQLKSFLAPYLPAQYPYRPLPQSNSQKIHYFLFTGFGLPPNDIGYPGDIYMDSTGHTYALYGRMKNHWEPWTGILSTAGKTRRIANLIVHPNFPGFYLWCKGNDITWLSYHDISKNTRKRANMHLSAGSIDVTALVARTEDNIYRGHKRKSDAAMLFDENTLKKRSKTVAEGQTPAPDDNGLNWILHDSFIRILGENKLLLCDVTDIRLGHTLATSQLLCLRSDYEQLQSKLVTLGEAKTGLEGELVVLRQESGKFKGQVQHLNGEMGTLRVDNLALKEDLCQSGVNYARLAEESKKVVEELRTFRANNFRLKEEVRRTGAKCSRLEADIKTGESMSKAQNNRLEDDLAAARKLLATADQEGQNSMCMLETLKKANLDLDGKNRNLLQRCGRLEKCVSLQINRSSENKELADANKRLQAQLVELEDNTRNTQAENQRLKEDLAREIRVIDQIRDKVAGVVAGEILAIFDDSDHLPRSQCLPKLKEEEKPTVVKEESD